MVEPMSESDARIQVINPYTSTPPCKVLIWHVPLFDVWVGKCECKQWRCAQDAGNTFGWFRTREAARRSAESHLTTMDDRRNR